ncbi:uncharacterized protein [Musca autumnalis]|uniref:uncharacterized protein n=1 Tax=Musca autumnalis TaxID=221902 RepID=UPI003CEEACED
MKAQLAHKQHNRWDEWIPEMTLALNTNISDTKCYSPAYLVQGREPRLPTALFDEVALGTGTKQSDPVSKANELQEIFEIVRHRLARAGEDQRRYYNLRRRPWKPRVGDRVLVKQHPLSKAVDNFAAKLAPKYGGPYVIVDFPSTVIVRAKILQTLHLSELKPYPNPEDPNPSTFHRQAYE